MTSARSQLVGSWRLVSDDDKPGQQTEPEVVSFDADGTWRVTEGREPLAGHYRVEDGLLVMTFDGDTLALRRAFRLDGQGLHLANTNVGFAHYARVARWESTCQPDDSDVQAIREVASGIVAADNRRDIERVLAYYAADAVLMPPGEAPVTGRDLIRPRYEALFAAFAPEIEAHIDEACAGAGLGFVRGRNGGRLVPRGSGEARVLDDAYLMLLRREAGGTWRISHLIWHRQSEPASRKVGP